MINILTKKRIEILLLIVVIAVAVLLRFGWLGVSSYAWDEARISYDALNMARNGEFAFAGQGSSVGVPFFPASVWVFAIPYLFSSDPLFVTIWITALNVLMVIGVWALARRWSLEAAFVAGIYAAALPFAVFYGRSIWQPNLLAPLTIIWLWSAYLGVTANGRKQSWGILLATLIGGLTVQIHFAGIALALATVYVFLRFRWYRQLIPVLIGGALAGIATLPYFYYIFVLHPDVSSQLGNIAGGGIIDLSAARNAVRMATGYDWMYLSGEGNPYSQSVISVYAAGLLLISGAAALIYWTSRHILSRKDSALSTETRNHYILAELALLPLVASLLFFLRHSTPVLPHYQLVAIPSFALIAGASVHLLRHRAWWRLGVMVFASVLAAVWAYQVMFTLDNASKIRPVNSAFGSILTESRDAAGALSPDIPVLFFTHGDDPLIDGEVTVFSTLLWDRPHRILSGDNLLILPPYPATMMMTLAPFQAWEELEASGLVSNTQTFPRREGALPFVATLYNGVTDPNGFTMFSSPVQFADGSTLLGWRARWVGERWRFSTLWRATQPPSDAETVNYQQFHHLYRPGDNIDSEPFKLSDVALSMHTWRQGDQVIVMADFFDVPAGEGYMIGIGHYTLPDLSRIRRVDGAGDRVLIQNVTVGER